ncbi:MAG: hypothetical protein CSA38_00330 [Flavobacteriales bacterium]|nr:MAG: hypothetical protein CSA38_00330 [Flavobacteriales bacterium]
MVNYWVKKREILKIGLIVFVASLLVMYIAMGKYSDILSRSNVSDGFIVDAGVFSFITSILFVLLFLILRKIKKKYLRVLIQLMVLNAMWLFCNYCLFKNYHSCWSTYTFDEELFYTVFYSILPMIIISILLILVINKLKLQNYEE